MGYIRETWDLHAAAAACFLGMALVLLWGGAISLWMVPVVTVAGSVLFVWCVLWAMAVAGGTIQW